MSRIIHYYINVWKQTDSMSDTWMMFNTDGNKTLYNKNTQDMATVTNEGTSQIKTASNYGIIKGVKCSQSQLYVLCAMRCNS
jgi:uncharacterized protein (DUF885 family)